MAAYNKLGLAIAAAVIVLMNSACGGGRTVVQGNEEFSIPEESYIEALRLGDDGRVFEAIQAWKEVIAEEPRWAMAHFNLAQLYDSKNLIDEAIESYEVAVRLDPDQGVYHLNLGSAYLRKGRSQLALDALRRAVEKDPFNPLVHYNLAGAYMSIKDYDHSLIHADEAVDQYAKPDPRTMANLAEGVDRTLLARMLARQAECHLVRGEIEKARQCAERIRTQCMAEIPAGLQSKLDELAAKDETEQG